MNKQISQILMTRLITLPYIDKFGGVVQTLQKVIPMEGEKPIIKRIPFSNVHQTQPCELIEMERVNVQFIPEAKLKGMLYFEDNGLSMDNAKPSSSLNFYRSRLRLVVWLNQKKISPNFDIGLAAIAMNEMIGMLSITHYSNTDIFKNIRVTVSSIPPATASLFSEYDYNEKESQFLLPPYDFFAIDLEIRFGVPKGCKFEYLPSEPQTC